MIFWMWVGLALVVLVAFYAAKAVFAALVVSALLMIAFYIWAKANK